MYILLLGILLFFGVHLMPSFVTFRQKMVTTLGARPYKVLFSILSLSGIILIVYGMSKADFQPLWDPPGWGRNVTVALMLFSILLLVVSDIKSNIQRFIRHPMLWGVTIWSGAHLLANGDLASLLLFGSFGTYALLDIFLVNRRGENKQLKKYPFTRDVVTIVAGLAVYGIILLLHPYLFGVSVI